MKMSTERLAFGLTDSSRCAAHRRPFLPAGAVGLLGFVGGVARFAVDCGFPLFGRAYITGSHAFGSGMERGGFLTPAGQVPHGSLVECQLASQIDHQLPIRCRARPLTDPRRHRFFTLKTGFHDLFDRLGGFGAQTGTTERTGGCSQEDCGESPRALGKRIHYRAITR